MVKLGHLGLEMSQLVQNAISMSNGLEMSVSPTYSMLYQLALFKTKMT